MSKRQAMEAASNDPDTLKRSRIEEKEGMEDAMKQYLNPHDRFATRMRASMKRGSQAEEGSTPDQQ